MKYLLLILVPLLTSCATNSVGTEVQTVDTSCSWVKVILVSKQDAMTDGTARQILAHNRLVEKNCPKK